MSEKNANSLEILKILAKSSLTKALLSQRHWLMWTVKPFQMMPNIIILDVKKFHYPATNCFGTEKQKPTMSLNRVNPLDTNGFGTTSDTKADPLLSHNFLDVGTRKFCEV